MEKLIYKAGTAVATAALILGSVSPFALADTTVEISGNGSGSTNEANVDVTQETSLLQVNEAFIENNVEVSANTGNNEANDNTGGDVSVDTGNANVSTSVSNEANSNVAEVNGCCPGDTSVEISGNGSDSDNTANVSSSHSVGVLQDNQAFVSNNVWVDANTGNNEANDNIGGNVSIDTGNADVSVGISNEVNKNVFSMGNGNGGSVTVEISGNGSGSTNEANVDITTELALLQVNEAFIENDVWIWANTGNNEANDNTGGDVEIDTGNANVEVDISNLANFNAADVDACGCLLDLTVKIKNNGSDSDNTANVSLSTLIEVLQDNQFFCVEDTCANVWVDSNTGDNESNDNTEGGEPEIDTGNAGASVTVENEVNSNVFGDVDLDGLDLDLPDSFFDVFGDASGFIVLLLALFTS